MKVRYARILAFAAILSPALFIFHTTMYWTHEWKVDFLHTFQATITDTRGENSQLQEKMKTLTRYGNDIRHFDVEMCPPSSIILNLTKMTPLHSDCPTLFIVGTPKGGTTTLIELVSMHPNFEGAELQKRGFSKGELFYFTRPPTHFKSPMTWGQYIKHFPTGVVTGESTSWYLSGCEVPKKLFQACGRKAKVVMLFRNPVRRIISQYVMHRMTLRKKNASVDLFVSRQLTLYNQAANKLYIRNVAHDWNKQSCMPQLDAKNVIYFGLYYVHLMNWLCNFPAENIMVVNSEEFFLQPQRIVTQVLNFIGLNSLPKEYNTAVNTTVYNKGRYDKFDTRMSDKLLEQLHNLYKPFNEALFELLSWEDVDWSSEV